MKTHRLFTIALILFSSMLLAYDKTVYTYRGQVAGVVCAACSEHVQAALKKLDGVSKVKITLAKEQGGAPQLEVTSTSPALTKAAAIAILGDQAAHYHILSFDKVK